MRKGPYLLSGAGGEWGRFGMEMNDGKHKTGPPGYRSGGAAFIMWKIEIKVAVEERRARKESGGSTASNLRDSPSFIVVNVVKCTSTHIVALKHE